MSDHDSAVKVQFKIRSPECKHPLIGYRGRISWLIFSNGYNISAQANDILIVEIDTGVSINIPEGFIGYVQLLPKLIEIGFLYILNPIITPDMPNYYVAKILAMKKKLNDVSSKNELGFTLTGYQPFAELFLIKNTEFTI